MCIKVKLYLPLLKRTLHKTQMSVLSFSREAYMAGGPCIPRVCEQKLQRAHMPGKPEVKGIAKACLAGIHVEGARAKTATPGLVSLKDERFGSHMVVAMEKASASSWPTGIVCTVRFLCSLVCMWHSKGPGCFSVPSLSCCRRCVKFSVLPMCAHEECLDTFLLLAVCPSLSCLCLRSAEA